MHRHHFTRKFFAQLLAKDGRASAKAAEQLLEHLLEVCPECREEYEELRNKAQKEGAGASLGEITARVITGLAETRRVLDRHEQRAQEDFAVLLAAESGERRRKIKRAFTRFRSPHLVGLLLKESRRQVTADPYEALDLAECANLVALHLFHDDFGEKWCMTELARSNAYRGNALRATGDLQEAEPQLEQALLLFQEHGNEDLEVQAEITGFLGSLRMDQYRSNDAERCFQEAARLYQEVGETAGLARELMKLATLYNWRCGETAKAVETCRKALAVLDPEEHSRLYFYAQHNLIFYLHEQGEFSQARGLLSDAEPIYERLQEPMILLRKSWLEGKIAFGLGESADAESIFLKVRKGFAKAGIGFDAGLVGLDLGLVYFEQGRTEELAKLAGELVPFFTAQNIHQEALAVVMLFRKAVEQGTVTRAVIEQTARALRQGPVRPRGGRPS